MRRLPRGDALRQQIKERCKKRESLAYLGSGTKTSCAASVKLPRYNLIFVAWLRIALGARVRSEDGLLCYCGTSRRGRRRDVGARQPRKPRPSEPLEWT